MIASHNTQNKKLRAAPIDKSCPWLFAFLRSEWSRTKDSPILTSFSISTNSMFWPYTTTTFLKNSSAVGWASTMKRASDETTHRRAKVVLQSLCRNKDRDFAGFGERAQNRNVSISSSLIESSDWNFPNWKFQIAFWRKTIVRTFNAIQSYQYWYFLNDPIIG